MVKRVDQTAERIGLAVQTRNNPMLKGLVQVRKAIQLGNFQTRLEPGSAEKTGTLVMGNQVLSVS